jgi:hypothetical protein
LKSGRTEPAHSWRMWTLRYSGAANRGARFPASSRKRARRWRRSFSLAPGMLVLRAGILSFQILKIKLAPAPKPWYNTSSRTLRNWRKEQHEEAGSWNAAHGKRKKWLTSFLIPAILLLMKEYEEEPRMKSSGTKPWRAIKYMIDSKGCWICTSHKPSVVGYPRIRRNKRLLGISRYIYTKYHGHVKDGLVIMHKCDNRLCINPDHLEAGTVAQNNIDMQNKGRSAGAHLNWNNIMEIRQRNIFTIEEADKWKITKPHLYKILRRLVWKSPTRRK